jgi:YfiH family protein
MMPVAETNPALLEPVAGCGWRLRGWASAQVAAGITNRRSDLSQWLGQLKGPVAVSAEQTHGGSLAVIGTRAALLRPVPGCDALLTDLPDVALLIRTADCLPILFADPSRRVVGIAHAGWRGLAASLPTRLVAALRHAYHSRPEALHVAIGPAIRSCCYEVGPEFAQRFGSFVRERDGRRTCDLIGVAVEQLVRCGVRPDRILDARRCTACETNEWFSLRREGPETGRLVSFIMLKGSHAIV